ncbi:T-complex protein 1 subunit beta [Morus notabilis]|uniref:CCT-beta n=1 Tax=Morus notabilis TaxID=981085 RepID=W9S424_9ROSA|nr:T-complex protein 1 subunit beta [Morus notabilis]
MEAHVTRHYSSTDHSQATAHHRATAGVACSHHRHRNPLDSPLSLGLLQQIENIFKDEAGEEKGERARMASFVGAMAIADLVKTTLGPKGMDKILQSTGRGREVTVTNDGATILKSLHIDNPAAKVLVGILAIGFYGIMELDISKVQDDEVGDGTTSVVILAGELLREAEKLVHVKIHPMTIISGFRMAAECARDALLEKVVDNKTDSEKFKSDLMKIAMTTLSSKILSQDKEHFAKLAVDAVLRLKGSTNLEAIQIIKKPGGSLKDSFLDDGFILDKKIGIGQPKRIENAKILVANTAMDTDKVKIYGARVRVDSMSRVAEIEGAEKEKMREKVQKIIAHGINCFVNRQLIYNFPEELFADAGILAIEHADFDGIERLALVTGGEIASTFDNPESVKLGHCKLIEEIMIGEDKLIHFSGVEMGQACTIVLRGASHHVLDEADRSLHDALCVLSQTVNDSRVLLGGGWPEMIMAKEVDELAKKTPGKKSHAIEAFSRALLSIPTIIADNAGLDSAELIAQLRAEHQKEGSTAGIDVITGSVGDMAELGISEAFKVKQAVLLSATEAAEMILRVDEIITCAPRRREDRM